MDSEVVVVLAFGVGTAGNLIKGVPQFLRTAVHGQVSGLAPGAVWLAVIANTLWACFGAAISDIAFFTLSVFALLLTSATAARFMLRTGWNRNYPFALVTLGLGLVFVTLAMIDRDQVLAGIGVTIGLVISVPQLVHLVRIRNTDRDVSGVSTLEYLVVITAQVAWTAYWLMNQQWLVAAGAAWGGFVRTITLSLLFRQAERFQAVSASRQAGGTDQQSS